MRFGFRCRAFRYISLVCLVSNGVSVAFRAGRLFCNFVEGSVVVGVTGILTTFVLANIFLLLSRFNYKGIEVLYTP